MEIPLIQILHYYLVHKLLAVIVVIIGHLMVPLSTGHVCADSEQNSPSLGK
jgi:hypothetical protein